MSTTCCIRKGSFVVDHSKYRDRRVILLPSRSLLLFHLLLLHSLLLCPLALEGAEHALHALVVRSVLFLLPLLLLRRKEARVLAQLADRTLALLLVLRLELRGLVALMIWVAVAQVVGRRVLEAWDVRRDGDWLVCLQGERTARLAREFQEAAKGVS